jgi:hypothetical protein
MNDQCTHMMNQKTQLAADVTSQDAELTELVAKMNRAPGTTRRIGLRAAVDTTRSWLVRAHSYRRASIGFKAAALRAG